MNILKNPVAMGSVGACLAVFLSFVENKINKKDRQSLDYLKVFFITFLGIYICNYIYVVYIPDTNTDEIIHVKLKKEISTVPIKQVGGEIKTIIPKISNMDEKLKNTVNIKKVVENIDTIFHTKNDINSIDVDTIDTGLPDF